MSSPPSPGSTVKVPLLVVPLLGSYASSGRAGWLCAARHSESGPRPLGPVHGLSCSSEPLPWSPISLRLTIQVQKAKAFGQVKVSDADHIFVRATKANAAVMNIFGRSSASQKAAAKMATISAKMASSSGSMHQHQFVAAVVRLASLKYEGKLPTLAQQLDAFILEHVHGMLYTELQLCADAFSLRLTRPTFKAVLRKHQDSLAHIFNFYSGIEHSAQAGAANSTMDIKEMTQLCTDAGFFDSAYHWGELVASFVRVNIDDELFEQADTDNSPSECVYDEFIEIVTRMYNSRENGGASVALSASDLSRQASLREEPSLDSATVGEPTEEETVFELFFDKWLESYFLPGSFQAISQRKQRMEQAVSNEVSEEATDEVFDAPLTAASLAAALAVSRPGTVTLANETSDVVAD